MNEKKSKRLRQLVKHLIAKEAVAGGEWATYVSYTDTKNLTTIGKQSKYENEPTVTTVKNTFGTHPSTGVQLFLDPACGRAIYQQMKLRDKLSHR